MEYIIQGSKIVREWKDRLEIFSRYTTTTTTTSAAFLKFKQFI